MSLYANYIKERLGHSIIETDDGFIAYSFPDPFVCVVEDLYVRPEARRKRVAWQLAEQVVKEALTKKCNVLVGRVFLGATGATESLKGQLAFGMELHHLEEGRIVLAKMIGESHG